MPDHHRLAKSHFKKHDPVIAQVIKQVGPFGLKPERNRFGMLVRSIISQQISTGAARAIRGRLELLVGDEGFSPAAIARLDLDQLRSAGVSPQKVGYLLDLAAKCGDGTVRLSRIGRLSDEKVIEELIQIKGVGRWTAQMFLIFSLGRLDVFPHDDLGVRSALRNLYGLADLPGKAECLAIGERWRPYSTVASWYCWRSLEFAKKTGKN